MRAETRALLMITIGFFCLPNIAHANCGFSNIEGDIEMASIGGAKVYTLFSAHLGKQPLEVRKALRLEGGTREDVSDRLNAILSNPKHQQTIKTEKAETARIINLLKSSSLTWVGIEASPKEMKGGPSIQMQMQVDIYKHTRESLLSVLGDVNKTDDILYLLFSSHVIARAKEPSAFERIRTVPIDDDEAKSKSAEVVFELDNLKQELIELGMEKQLLSPEQFMAINGMKADALKNNKVIPSERITAEQERFKNEEVKKTVGNLLSKANEFLHLSAKRDEAAAKSILNQSGDGIVLMGTAHGPGVTSHLNSACGDTGFPKSRTEDRTENAVK